MNREEWLTKAAGKIARNVLAPGGYEKDSEGRPLQDAVKVTCGWPHKGGTSAKRRRLGECWPLESSAGNVRELFISPALYEPIKTLGVLVHELLHAHFKVGVGHNKTFAHACIVVGLEGPATATKVGDSLRPVLEEIAEDLGPYPHSELMATAPEKKQGTRDRKAYCANTLCESHGISDGGFKLRMTKVWMVALASGDLNEDGLPSMVTLCCPFCDSELAIEEQ